MKVISFDPSGNWGKEGYGTTGLCFMKNGEPIKLDEIKASNYDSEVGYWDNHIGVIEAWFPEHVVIEGYKLYNHKGKNASMQANSELQTPQLIGALKLKCHQFEIPYTIQFASEVKSRWSDNVLQNLGYLDESGKFKGERTNNHKRDALRHGLHFVRYGVKKYENS